MEINEMESKITIQQINKTKIWKGKQDWQILGRIDQKKEKEFPN
jgi:hypothetical protein